MELDIPAESGIYTNIGFTINITEEGRYLKYTCDENLIYDNFRYREIS